MSVNDTVAQDTTTNFTFDQVRVQLNNLIRDFAYHRANGLSPAAILTPIVARGTTASKVKTTQATHTIHSGVQVAAAAVDDAWTLTGGTLAAGFVRRYLLLRSAGGVFTVLASDDQTTAAACRWAQRPADGLAIMGILTVANATNPFVPGTTLLSATGVTDTYQDGVDANVFAASIVQP